MFSGFDGGTYFVIVCFEVESSPFDVDGSEEIEHFPVVLFSGKQDCCFPLVSIDKNQFLLLHAAFDAGEGSIVRTRERGPGCRSCFGYDSASTVRG